MRIHSLVASAVLLAASIAVAGSEPLPTGMDITPYPSSRSGGDLGANRQVPK